MMGAKLPCQWFFVLATRNRNGLEPELRSELHAEMSEPTKAQHGNDLAGAGAAVPQCVEGRDAGAHQRRRLNRIKVSGYAGEGRCRCDHVIGIPAVGGYPSDKRFGLAGKRVTPTASIAVAAIAAVPADADPLA